MKKILFGLSLVILGVFCKAQNGLENITVEKYYISNAADSAASSGVLPVNSVTYRIYADMRPGYKFQMAYGNANHNLIMTTSTTFFNNTDYGLSTPDFSKTNASQNSVMLDSWLSVGAACVGNYGVLKTADDGVANILNSDGILHNTDAAAGIPLTTQDGFLAGTPQENVTFVGITNEADVFGDGSVSGNSFVLNNAAWSSLNGSMGADTTNKVLIAQITTNGTFHYELNVQIGTPTGGIETYVVRNPQTPNINGINERTIPSLQGTFYSPIDSLIHVVSQLSSANYTIPSWTLFLRAQKTLTTNHDNASYNNMLTVLSNMKGANMPYNVVMNINKDPRTKMAFNWFTNAGVTGGQVQIIQGTATDETSFASPLMVINAKCDSVKNLNYNVSANNLLTLAGIANNSKKSYTRNRVLASGLTPNTLYSYRVGKNGAWSTIGSFTTAKDTKEPFSFVYVTDPQAQTDAMFNVSQTTTHAAQAMYPNANFWLSCGDLVESSGTSNSEWEYEQYFETQQDIFMKKPFAPIEGNHDVSTNKNWTKHFNTDSVAFDYANATVPGSVYSYVYGDALFMAMSYENYSTPGYLDSLANWMTAQVNAHPEVKWRIANFHKTMYTGSSSHQSDADGKAVRDRMAPVFDTLKIDLALEGHDHIYEIIGPVKNKALVPGEVSNQTSVTPNTTDNLTGKLGGKFDVNKGTLYFLNNSAGKKKYLPRTAAQMNAAFAATQITNYFGLFSGRFGQNGLPTFSNVTVSTDSITISTYSVDSLGNSTLFDAFSIVKTPKAFAVTGTGNYCQGTTGLAVGLNGSELGVTYTITPGGQTVVGTGSAISFGNKLAGTYTISGTSNTGTTAMTGSAVLTEIQIPAAPTKLGDYYNCNNVAATVYVTVPTNCTAKWYDASNVLVNTGTYYNPGLVIATYNVESYNTLAGCVSPTRTVVNYTASEVTATINNTGLYETSYSGLTDHITINATTGFPTTYSLIFTANAISAGFVNTPVGTPYTSNQILINIPTGSLSGNYNATLTLNNAVGCSVSKTITISYPINQRNLTLTKTRDIGTTCLMSWDPSTLISPNAADPATSFTFQYRPVNTTVWIGASSTTNSIKLSNLTPNTNYECRVFTYKKYQAPSPLAGQVYQFSISITTNFTTATISYTKTQDIGTNSLITWKNGTTTDSIPGFATSYTFQYKKQSASIWTGVGISNSTPKGKMINTDTSAVYNCQVAVYYNGAFWGTTAAGNVTTGKVIYSASNRTASSLKLTWTEANATPWSPVAPTYTFQYKLSTSSTWTGLSTAGVNSTTLNNLTSGATYNCRVYYYMGTLWGLSNEGTFKAGLTTKNEITTTNTTNVYPNPFVDNINLDLFTEQGTKVTWNIYDLTGKIVLSGNEEITSGYSTLKIDAANLSKGVYMLNAIMDNQLQNFRIIKQ